MKAYENICEGKFCQRNNRFIAIVNIDGKEEVCHVKNTGRCRELLVPGAKVYLEKSTNPKRKTAYDLVAVQKGERLVNMDSQLPNAVAYEWIAQGGFGFSLRELQREVTYGDSRYDLYGVMEDGTPCFIEVKGVTLEEDGIARFPDAPTQRGVKHINGLIRGVKEGLACYILFVIQMKGVKYFTPNDKMHPQFGEALRRAVREGVNVLAVDCEVTVDSMRIQEPVLVRLEEEDGV